MSTMETTSKLLSGMNRVYPLSNIPLLAELAEEGRRDSAGVVSSAETFRRSDHPVCASLRSAHPPLLCEEGECRGSEIVECPVTLPPEHQFADGFEAADGYEGLLACSMNVTEVLLEAVFVS